MSLSLRGFATRTSWPHSSSTRLTHGEWVPASMAMRMGRSEAKRRLKVSGLVRSLPSHYRATCCVDEAQVGVFVAYVQSGCHLRLLFATIHGWPILLSISGIRARRTFADPKGTAYGGRPSHLIFRELR